MAEYIERDKVYQDVGMLVIDNDDLTRYEDGRNMGVFNAMSVIENAPAADVRPERHGEWKGYTTSAFRGMDEFGDPIYRDVNVWVCSECCRKSVVKENFCSNCGAKMDGKGGNTND